MILKINFKPLAIFTKIRILYAWPGSELPYGTCITNIYQQTILLSCEVW